MTSESREGHYYAASINLNGQFVEYYPGDTTDSDATEPRAELDKISPVNIFVGPNNSGKSRFLRKLAVGLGRLECVFELTNADSSEIEERIKDIGQAWPHSRKTYEYRRHISEFQVSYDRLLEGIFNPLCRMIEQRKIGELDKRLAELEGYLTNELPSGRPRNDFRKMATEVARFQALLSELPDEPDYSLFYLPVLRGLRPLKTPPVDKFVTYDDAPSPYDKRTVSDYFADAEHPPEVFTGEKLYWRVREMLLGNEEKRQKIRAFERYLSENFFSLDRERSVNLIPRTDDDVLFVKIGDEEEKPIYKLGDGIQSIIILTFLVHIEEHAIFFIEEPDIFLHPGLQRRLIECFCDKPQHQFFLTTHSNHLLDLTLDFDDISIFKFEKICEGSYDDGRLPKFSIECVEDGDDSVLAKLGVRNSSVFLVNATIWVEGITDRMYLRHYFEKWQEKKKTEDENFTVYREDTHFAFVEYGGGNVGHFFEEIDDGDAPERPMDVERLTGRAFVVMDADGDRQVKLEKYEHIPGERLHVLKCREIENLLPKELLEAHIARREGEFEFPEEMEWDVYKDERLGEWLQNEFEDELELKYASKSGALRSDLKRDFAKWTADMVEAEHLTEPIEELMQQMYEHIDGQHRHIGS